MLRVHNCFRSCWLALAVFMMVAGGTAARAATYDSDGIITSPEASAQFTANGMGIAQVQVSSDYHYVEITNAGAQEFFNVSWELQLLSGATILDSDDDANQVIQCDETGAWRKRADNTTNGSLGVNVNFGVGNGSIKIVASLNDNNTMGTDALWEHEHQFSVVAP